MKTLTINLTNTDTVTLVYSEKFDDYDVLSGNMDLLWKMALEAGWNYQECKIKLADWAAQNQDLFVTEEEKEVTAEQLWNGEEVGELEANGCSANEVTTVVVYHDVNDKPQGFDSEEKATKWIKKEIAFGDYEMSFMTIEEFKEIAA